MAEGTVAIREVRPEEHAALGELTVAAYREVFGPGLGEYADELRAVDRRAAHAHVLVAVQAGAVVGGVTYVPGPGPYAEFEADDEAGIRMLVVAPEARGRGIGTALVQACVERAVAAGRSRLSLHTDDSMLAARRIYEREGFRRAPERDWLDPDLRLLAYVLHLDPVRSA